MILIINDNKREGTTSADIFRQMGILSIAVSSGEFFSEYSSMYRAILIFGRLASDVGEIGRIREYVFGTPIFAVTDAALPEEAERLFDRVFPASGSYVKLASMIRDAAESMGAIPCGSYALAGIYAGIDQDTVTYFDTTLPFTKTEAMIIRYLIASYPMPQAPAEILKRAFKTNRAPEPSSVRTHISVINKKFRAAVGGNLITSKDIGGYLIITPEFVTKLNRASALSI